MVTTDRLSAFDRILAAVPYKGQVLNQLSAWWFEHQRYHPQPLLRLPDPNAVLAREVEPFPVEVIVRGYITGVTTTALWYRYSLGERRFTAIPSRKGCRRTSACLSRSSPPPPRAGHRS